MDIKENISTYKRKIDNFRTNYIRFEYYTKIIHYSCEDIKNSNSRIICISILDLYSKDVKSFSLHYYVQKFPEIKDKDKVEKILLDDYFEYLSNNKHCYWVHWNMNNDSYGFGAIENRYKILNGNPFVLENKYKFSLSNCFYDVYGDNYIEHPRFYTLLKINKYERLNLLDGKEEIKKSKEENYAYIFLSTQDKVNSLNYLYDLFYKGNLKTNKKIWQIYGLTFQGIFDLIKDYWLGSLLTWFFGIIIGCLISALFDNI